jgi:hypothetical protein
MLPLHTNNSPGKSRNMDLNDKFKDTNMVQRRRIGRQIPCWPWRAGLGGTTVRLTLIFKGKKKTWWLDRRAELVKKRKEKEGPDE